MVCNSPEISMEISRDHRYVPESRTRIVSMCRLTEDGTRRRRKRMQEQPSTSGNSPPRPGNQYSPFPTLQPDPDPVSAVQQCVPDSSAKRDKDETDNGISRHRSALLPLSWSGTASPPDVTVHRNIPPLTPMVSEIPEEGSVKQECQSPPCSPGPVNKSSDIDQYLYRYLPKASSDADLERLTHSLRGLSEGCFYYPDLDSDAARTLLHNAAEGSFLVRDSSDAKFLFSLTVKTARGATSVRIQYHRGFFQLDCEDPMKRKLPRFETLLELLDFHMTMCRNQQGVQYRWLESSRRTDMVVRLTNARRHTVPSLVHLARVAVNRNLVDLHLPSRSTDLLPLPSSLKQYLRAYPYKV